MRKIEIEEKVEDTSVQLKYGNFYKDPDGNIYLACMIDHTDKYVLVDLKSGNRYQDVENQPQYLSGIDLTEGWTELAPETIIKITV